VSPLIISFSLLLGLLKSDGLSSKKTSLSRSSLISDLQRCFTARELLDRVGRRVSPSIDADGTLASLVWVRLCKHLIHEDNRNFTSTVKSMHFSSLDGFEDEATAILSSLTAQLVLNVGCQQGLGPCATHQDAALELTKAACVISRLGVSSSIKSHVYHPIAGFWIDRAAKGIGLNLRRDSSCELLPHQLSGLKWAFDSFSLSNPNLFTLPSVYLEAYEKLELPFCVIPGCIRANYLSVDALLKQVDFRVDEIRTNSNQLVSERRHTAWQGDEGVRDFAYSSKSMPRQEWSPLVRDVRDQLYETTFQRYDCCLLNLYPDGESAMRYHADPDQGTLWDYETAVVSVGATRKVAFRPSKPNAFPVSGAHTSNTPHAFHVLNGDLMFMFGDCQERFQHTVKKTGTKREESTRSSMVFKRTWGMK
jgi:alkylated DNA repair dioxygenase AlkB